MRLSSRSYPHPVLGNGDDVPGAAFQAAYEYASDRQFYYITVTMACSSKTLNRLISTGGACYVLHVECSNTMYRRAFEFTEGQKRFPIPASHLNDIVEVNAFVRAKRDLSEYRIEGAHSDYGSSTFQVNAGDILAVGEGQFFHAETSHDSLRRIGSIMVIEKSLQAGDHPMNADFTGDKIRIFLCERDFDAYSRLKSVPSLTSHLTTTIVLPVLLEALHYIEGESEGLQALNWFRNLERRIDMLSLREEKDTLTKAQGLLDMPIRRALASAEKYAEGMNS